MLSFNRHLGGPRPASYFMRQRATLTKGLMSISSYDLLLAYRNANHLGVPDFLPRKENLARNFISYLCSC